MHSGPVHYPELLLQPAWFIFLFVFRRYNDISFDFSCTEKKDCVHKRIEKVTMAAGWIYYIDVDFEYSVRASPLIE